MSLISFLCLGPADYLKAFTVESHPLLYVTKRNSYQFEGILKESNESSVPTVSSIYEIDGAISLQFASTAFRTSTKELWTRWNLNCQRFGFSAVCLSGTALIAGFIKRHQNFSPWLITACIFIATAALSFYRRGQAKIELQKWEHDPFITLQEQRKNLFSNNADLHYTCQIVNTLAEYSDKLKRAISQEERKYLWYTHLQRYATYFENPALNGNVEKLLALSPLTSDIIISIFFDSALALNQKKRIPSKENIEKCSKHFKLYQEIFLSFLNLDKCSDVKKSPFVIKVESDWKNIILDTIDTFHKELFPQKTNQDLDESLKDFVNAVFKSLLEEEVNLLKELEDQSTCRTTRAYETWHKRLLTKGSTLLKALDYDVELSDSLLDLFNPPSREYLKEAILNTPIPSKASFTKDDLERLFGNSDIKN